MTSDLVLRQYSRVKGEKGKAFTYKDMRPVYTIIFFEKSLSEFKAPALNGKYLHFGKTVFDTGLELELLQRFYLISLDVFSKNKYPMDKNDLLAVPACHPQCRRSLEDPRRLSMAGGNLSGHGVVSSQTGGGADNVFRCFENLRSQYRTIYD